MPQGLVQIRKLSVFASDLINNRRYWTAHVHGDYNNDHFCTRDVGRFDILKVNIDSINHNFSDSSNLTT